MSDEIVLDGKQYVPSKQASIASGYAQDYIGQLARKGFIDAKRISGLWYVEMSSLMGYKKTSEAKVREAPERMPERDPEALIFFDGAEYISTSRAAEMTGYNPDYVGQLARSGAVVSKQVGNRWYVDRTSIQAHKKSKDSLLGAVQSESVGIVRKTPTQEYEQKRRIAGTFQMNTRYVSEEKDLFPRVRQDENSNDAEIAEIPIQQAPFRQSDFITEDQNILHIRPKNRIAIAVDEEENESVRLVANRKFKFKVPGFIFAILGGGIIILAIGYALISNKGLYATSSDLPQKADAKGAFQIAADMIENVLSPDIFYSRPQ